MDNVQPKMGFLQSNPWMTGHFVWLFTLLRKNLHYIDALLPKPEGNFFLKQYKIKVGHQTSMAKY